MISTADMRHFIGIDGGGTRSTLAISDENGRVIRRYPTLPFDARELERDCFICQPAAFFRGSE